jgi:hypothetical protein
MKKILPGKIQGHFLPSFSCFATTPLLITARQVWNNDQNSDGEAQQISNGSSIWGALCDTTP